MAFNEWKENSCLAVDSGSGQNHSLENWTNNHFLFIKFKQPFYFFTS